MSGHLQRPDKKNRLYQTQPVRTALLIQNIYDSTESILPEGGGLESKETRSITIAIKKMVFAITAVLPATIPNPIIPAISAIIKNKIALRIIKHFFQELN